MQIKLVSNFHDFYDHAFYPGGDTVWERNTHTGMNRREMLAFLDNAQLTTPAHGKVKDIAPMVLETAKRELGITDEELVVTATGLSSIELLSTKDKQQRQLDLAVIETQRDMLKEYTYVVVYLDEMAHRGEGKLRLPAREALTLYPDAYCSRFVHTTPDSNTGFSTRILTIGNISFVIEYLNSKDWRSNVGDDVQIAVTGRLTANPTFTPPSPIFAIDFVNDGKNFLAIDLNIAPGLHMLKDKVDAEGNPYITAQQIYDAVLQFMENH